jgi:hypothetical protein
VAGRQPAVWHRFNVMVIFAIGGVTVRVKTKELAWITLAIVLMVVGCGTSATQSPPTLAPTPVPPTQTPEPTPVPPTETPEPTAVPPTETPEPTAAPVLAFPTGIFAKGSRTWEFKPDGTYITEGHTQLTAGKYSGTYAVTGDQVAIQDDHVACKDVVGTYAWTYDGEVLTLTKVEDKCRDRAGTAWGKWRKQP